MEPVSRRAFGLGVASLAACGRLEEPGAPRDDAGTSPAAFNPDARPLCAFPAWPALGVDPNAPARRTLYSWTSTAQAEQLAADKQLYTRTADDLGRAGYLFELLAQRARGGDEVARALSHEEFRLGRFCWTSPWASQLAGEDYGTELIRIDLSRNSLFVLVDSERETYSAVDIDNRPVAVAEALRQKERVAGIFFTNAVAAQYGCNDTFAGGTLYREFHLCHIATVDSWSLATEELDAELAANIELLRPLTALEPSPCMVDSCDDLIRQWRRPAVEPFERFVSCLMRVPYGVSFADWIRRAIGQLEVARRSRRNVRHRPNG